MQDNKQPPLLTPFTDVMGAFEEAEYVSQSDGEPKWIVAIKDYYIVTDEMPRFIERVSVSNP